MRIVRHGLSIGLERTEGQLFLSLKAQGKLTHQDYETITPLIDSAVAAVKDPKIKALIDATEWEGWEPRAAWDDFKLGLRHGKEFEKIAVYGNKGWQEVASKVGNWFVSGEVRYFDEEAAAVAWLHS